MSEQLTSQSRSNESGITRRTALRGAAWSASAVTVVVAAPAYANASDLSVLPGVTFSYNSSNVLTVTSSLNVARGTAVTAVVTVSFSGGNGVTVTSASANSPWTKPANAAPSSMTFTGTVSTSGAQPATFRPILGFSNNSFKSVTVTITYTWDKGSGTAGGTYTNK